MHAVHREGKYVCEQKVVVTGSNSFLTFARTQVFTCEYILQSAWYNWQIRHPSPIGPTRGGGGHHPGITSE